MAQKRVGGNADGNGVMMRRTKRERSAASEAATYQLFCAWDPYHRCGAGDGRSVADGAFACVLMAQFAS